MNTPSDRAAWFREATFGMFIHWGLYALTELGEHAQRMFSLPTAGYEALAERLDPAPDTARQWAALARRAGARYAVLTTKHHDGFCLFDSQLTDYTSARRGARRDYVREFVEAARAEGLRVGLYYSLADGRHPAYAAVAAGDRTREPELQAYLHGHVRELLSNYGRIDLLWYDGPFCPAGYLPAETIGAGPMNALARSLQPDILINDRSMLPEDISTPENECKPAPPGRDWEMCICINDIWGYYRHDHNYKTLNQLVFLLVNSAVQGGNLLLNVGPRGDGSVPREQTRRMEALGDWLRVHGESVYGVERLARPFCGCGRLTRRAGRLYVHAFYWPGETLRLPELTATELGAEPGHAPVRATVLTTGRPARARWDGTVLEISGLPPEPPDCADTVIALDPAR